MTPARTDAMISRLAFRAAMKKAFEWEFPLPDDALKALINSPEFDEIFEQNLPTRSVPFASTEVSPTFPVSPQDYEAEHFEALANDARVQLFINEYLAKEKERDYLRTLAVFLWKELQHGFRNWIRRLLNPSQDQKSGTEETDRPSRPARRRQKIRNPVLKTAAVAAVSFTAYLLYQHPPKIEITMIAPREFPHLQIDSTPVKFDSAKVHFSDIKFQDPPELTIAKLQFAAPPTLQIAKLQFDTPPTLRFASLPDFKFAPGSSIHLDAGGSTISLAQSVPLKIDPLQVKDGFIPLKFDPEVFTHPPKFQLDVNHKLDGVLNSNSGFRFSDKNQGFFHPSHVYSWELIPKSPAFGKSQKEASIQQPREK
jgi:hypothetical protein